MRFFPARLWVQISTGQSAYIGLAGVQIGFPFQHKSREPKDDVRSSQAQTKAPDPIVDLKEVRVTLDSQKVFFGTNSAALQQEMKKVLGGVGEYLEAQEKGSTVQISGHADQRGTFQHNLTLSEKRAESVKSALLSGKLDSSRMSLKGFSFLQPLDPANTETAWAKNRRVELIFKNVENTKALVDRLKPLVIRSEGRSEGQHSQNPPPGTGPDSGKDSSQTKPDPNS